MDRKSQSSDSAIASALLEKLKNDLALNAEDRHTVEEEAAAAAVPGGKRYTFRTMSKAEYLAKKSIADKIAAAADDADITDEELEDLLRNYFAGKAAGEKDEADAKDEKIEKNAETEENTDGNDAVAAAEKTAEPAADSTPVIMDPAQPLTETEELFVEELPVDVDGLEELADLMLEEPVSAAEEIPAQTEKQPEEAAVETAEAAEPAEDAENLLPWLESDDASDLFAEFDDKDKHDFEEETPDPVPTERENDIADISVPAADVLAAADTVSAEEDGDLAALLAELPEDALDGTIPEEQTIIADAEAQESLPAEDAVAAMKTEETPDAADPDALEDILADTEALLEELELPELSTFPEEPTDPAAAAAETAQPAPAETETPTAADTDASRKAEASLPSLDDMFGDLLPGEEAADSEEALADMLAAISEDGENGTAAEETPDVSDSPVQAAEETDPAASAEESADAAKETAADPDSPEFDQTDLDLMIAFGMDEQLEKAVGKEEAKKYKKAIGDRKDDHYREMHHSDRPDTVQDRHAEYVSGAQNKEIFAEYKKQYGSLLFRFLGAILFLLLLFFFENNRLIGLKLPAIFDREQYPLVYTLFDLQLVLLSGAMIAKSIRTGIRGIFRARPIPESITGFLFLACIVYSVVIALLCPMHGLQLYNFPIALTVIFALCYEYMNLRREIMSFKIVSSKKLKYAVDAIAPKDGEAEKNMFAEYIADDPSMFRIKRTAFVENFFQRTETYPKTQRVLRTVLPAVLILMLGFFAADFMLTGSVYQALTVAYITMLLALPSCAFIAFSYPMYRASSFAYEKDSAMIGEASLGEYADASVVSFDDKEVFPAQGVHVRSVKVYGNNRIDHVVYAAASVFHVVGGPLSDVFETATGELGYAENVKLVKIDRDGIEARVDGGAVLCGRASFVTRYGYSVSVSESEKAMEETGDASILYVAYENNLAAKLYIQYSVDPEFETVLKQLYRQGVCVGIKSSDPNIDDHLLSCKIKMSKYPVRIIKCAEPKETAIIVDRLSSGIVSKASAKSLLQTLAMCDRVLSASRTNNIISVVSILLAMAAMAFFVVSGISLTVAPLWIALYQLFWIIPVIAVSRYHI